ncbi:MAG TPA: acetolactate synthase small subunit [Terriglobales bacterium]|nr:acetolactate synthase small subunit [Terriglobales bacterium]
MVRTFIVYVADHPGVLNRVSSLFRRRGYNIESLTVGHTHQPGISRMTVVVAIDEIGAPLVMANLYKLAEVIRVDDITKVPAVHRELMIVKVASNPATQSEVLRVLASGGARVLETSNDSVVAEATGPEDAINHLIESLRPFEILELTRTGRVAMTSQASALHAAVAAGEEQRGPFWNLTHSADLPRNCS